MLQTIAVEKAVGMVLGHDLTRIVPGQGKGPAFRKGHIIRPEDVPVMLSMGKEHIYALELSPEQVHEDEAARRLARAAAGPGLRLSGPCEGRVTLTADRTGLLRIDVAALGRLNRLEDIVFATLHANHRVDAGTPVAGTRIVPLLMEERQLAMAEGICSAASPLIQVAPFTALRVGLIVTGSEIFHGRIKDAFGPVVQRKLEALGSVVFRRILVSDDVPMTVSAIHELAAQGAQMIVLTGGMSVDPDDQTPASIRASGATIVSYGAPVLPGAMFLLAYLGAVPVLGLPGCVMYHRTTIFDLVVPRLLAGERLDREALARLGHGGLCAGCEPCRYPLCGFGKV
jgi:molybdopterin biosynthesis enzyme